MIKFYARQVAIDKQDSGLFFRTRENKLCFEDDYFTNEVIIYGNDDYLGITTNEFEKILRIYSNIDELEEGRMDFDEYCNCYFAKSNGAKYTSEEINKWKSLFERGTTYYEDDEDFVCGALELMTDKKWRYVSLKGSAQRDYQYAYVSDQVSDEMVAYLEICYFNTGSEYMVYESKEDFDNKENGFSVYVDSYNSEEELIKALGCDEDEVEIYNFTGYTKVANYERVGR